MAEKVVFICRKCSNNVAAVYGQAITMRCPRCGSIEFKLPALEGEKETKAKAEKKVEEPKEPENILTKHSADEKASDVNLMTGAPLPKKESTKKTTKKKTTKKSSKKK